MFIIFVLLPAGGWTLEQPGAPQLLSPNTGSVFPLQPVKLEWSTVSGALIYDVSLSNSEAFYSDIIETDQTFYNNPRLYSGQWFWQVRARTLETSGPWSVIWNYTLEPEQPTPTPSAFPNVDISGDEVLDSTDVFAFSFSWGTQSGEERYNYVADLEEDGVIDPEDLLRIASVWHLRGATPCEAPELIGPASGAEVTFLEAQTPGLTWQPVAGAGQYNILINNEAGNWPLQNKLIQSASYSFVSTVQGVYRWKVRARDPKSLLFGTWSEERYFQLTSLPE